MPMRIILNPRHKETINWIASQTETGTSLLEDAF
jgi:hypothetical protein